LPHILKLRPGELGVLLGLDRAPEVKTLRRKLWELAGRGQAPQFSQRLAERWVRDQADAVGLLYVDGHVRPYHGTAHTLPEAWSAKRRLCLPATTDIWVNQQDAQSGLPSHPRDQAKSRCYAVHWVSSPKVGASGCQARNRPTFPHSAGRRSGIGLTVSGFHLYGLFLQAGQPAHEDRFFNAS
jgi:hypothetical protein